MTGDEGASLVSEHGEASDGKSKRDSMWKSAADTCKFLGAILVDKSLVVRDEDKFSSLVLSIFLFVGLATICIAAGLAKANWLPKSAASAKVRAL